MRINFEVARTFVYIPIGLLVLCSNILFANDKIEVGARVLYQRFNDIEAKEGSLNKSRFLIPSGSLYYRGTTKNRVGLEFSYWEAGYSSNGVGSLEPPTWHFYRTGIGYKRSVFDNRNPGEPIKALVGARSDYYRSYLKFDFDLRPQTVTYNNLGLAVNAEGRYSIFSFWGEYMFVRLSGGDKPKSPSAWDYTGTPNLNLYGFAFGMGLVFGI